MGRNRWLLKKSSSIIPFGIFSLNSLTTLRSVALSSFIHALLYLPTITSNCSLKNFYYNFFICLTTIRIPYLLKHGKYFLCPMHLANNILLKLVFWWVFSKYLRLFYIYFSLIGDARNLKNAYDSHIHRNILIFSMHVNNLRKQY